MTLYKCKKNKFYKVSSTPKNHLLKVLGVRVNTEFTVETKHGLGGPIVLKIGNRVVAIAKPIAESIDVQELNKNKGEAS